MKIIFTESAWEDYLYWQQNDRKKLRRINELIRGTCRQPYEGIGKPEQLRYEFSGHWSRRIDQEHRLVYKVKEDSLVVEQCRYRYD